MKREIVEAPKTVDEAPDVAEAKGKLAGLQDERRKVTDALATPDETPAELAQRLLENPGASAAPKADKPALQRKAEGLDGAIGLQAKVLADARLAASRLILAEGAPALDDSRVRIAEALGELQAALDGESTVIADLAGRGVRAPVRPVAMKETPGLHQSLAGLAQALKSKDCNQ